MGRGTSEQLSVASLVRRVRHATPLRDHEWLWRHVRRPYHAYLSRRSRRGGIERRVGGHAIRVRYPYSELAAAYEAAVVDALLGAARPGAIVFDVGANFGLYTLLAARAVGPAGRVFAFEPAAATAGVLEDHVTLNGVAERVEVVLEVVDDRTGTVEFWEHGTSLAASLSEASARTGEEFVEGHATKAIRPAVSIDDFCRRRSVQPDVVKIDAEGAEARILRGGASLLAARRATILLEVHPWSLTQLGDSHEQVLALLGDAGWACETLGSDGNTVHYLCRSATGA